MKNSIFLFTLATLTLFSCNDAPKKQAQSESQTAIDGFWDRTGTIKLVNGIAVDTLFFADQPDSGYRQVKAFKNGRVMWLNNLGDSINNPWRGGMGGFGKFTLSDENLLTEDFTNGTGVFGGMIKNIKDSLNVDHTAWSFSTTLNEDSFSQLMPAGSFGETEEFMEYFEKLEPSSGNTKLDGIWKRVYEITYVNGVPVDTTTVGSDVVLDVKIMDQGRYMYQQDNTGLFDVDHMLFGGSGGYGQFEFDEENGILLEYTETGSGAVQPYSFKPSTEVVFKNAYSEVELPDGMMNFWKRDSLKNTNLHNVNFYNDDLFQQISVIRDPSGDLSKDARGVVYKRVN